MNIYWISVSEIVFICNKSVDKLMKYSCITLDEDLYKVLIICFDIFIKCAVSAAMFWAEARGSCICFCGSECFVANYSSLR
jgi:hypothetical protein